MTLKSILLSTLLLITKSTFAIQFEVNTELDLDDANLNDGLCLTAQGSCSIRAAIAQSNSTVAADLITIPTGQYTIELAGINENTNNSGDFDILQPVTIIGSDRNNVTINGNSIDRIFDIHTNGKVIIEQVTLTGGTDQHPINLMGSALLIRPDANLSVNDIMISQNGHNESESTAAILQLGTFNASNIIISDNFYTAIMIDGPVTKFDNCLISEHNGSVITVAGIEEFSEHDLIEFKNCSIVNNITDFDGIMIINSQITDIFIINTTIANNTGKYLFFNDNFSMMHFINSTLYQNQIDSIAGSVNIDVHNTSAQTTRYTNTIMANNGDFNSEADLGGFLSLGGNYISKVHENLVLLPTDVVSPSKSVGLKPLSIINDFTQVFIPKANSILVDNGILSGCPVTDQLGQTRPEDGNGDAVHECDKGSIEFIDLIFKSTFD